MTTKEALAQPDAVFLVWAEGRLSNQIEQGHIRYNIRVDVLARLIEIARKRGNWKYMP